MWGKKFPIIVLITLGMMVSTQSCLANPLPAPDDIPGGGLLPGDLSKWMDSNRSIFLKNETINVTFNQEEAMIQALYVLKNEGANETSLDIELPFSRIPSNVQLMVNGNDTSFSWTDINGIDVPHTFPTFTSVHSIYFPDYSIRFSLSFESYEEKQVNVTYHREYKITGSRYDDKIVSEFRYIVGTSRWWKYPLESAYFEFWVLKKSFDRGAVLVMGDRMVSPSNIPSFFVNSTTKDYVCLSVNYKNWMPVDDDFLVLYWEKAKPFLQTKLGGLIFPTTGFILSVTVVIGSIWLHRRLEDHKNVKFLCWLSTLLFLLLSFLFLPYLILLVITFVFFS